MQMSGNSSASRNTSSRDRMRGWRRLGGRVHQTSQLAAAEAQACSSQNSMSLASPCEFNSHSAADSIDSDKASSL